MTDMPPIPDGAVDAGERAIYTWQHRGGSMAEIVGEILNAARPHLYAAALRHAAENLVHEAAAANQLRRMAVEAAS